MAELPSASEAVVALGSNLGDRRHQLQEALRRLAADPEIELLAVSSLYETEPVGPAGPDPFFNQAAAVRTRLDPPTLLQRLLEIEASLGRIRLQRWGPRTIDLDLILYEDAQVSTPELELPHPRFAERNFVVLPLLELLRSGRLASPCWAAVLDRFADYRNRDGIIRVLPA